MAKRPQVGDIVEFKCPNGLVFAQMTHIHTRPPKYGQLLRVFPGFHEARPPNFAALANSRSQFMTFFPLGSAIVKGVATVIGNAPVPAGHCQMPLFRVMGMIDKHTKKAKSWSLWNGIDESKLTAPLTDLQKSLPILEIVNDTTICERIASGWHPAIDVHT